MSRHCGGNGMKRQILCVAALLTVLLLVLTGCDFGRQKKLEEAYCTDVAASIEDIGEANTALTDSIRTFFDDVTAENRQGVMTALDGLDAAYAALQDLTPPEKYVSIQDTFRYGVDLALRATAIYREQFEAVEEETVDETFAEKVQEGDDLIRQAQAKLLEGSSDLTALTETE